MMMTMMNASGYLMMMMAWQDDPYCGFDERYLYYGRDWNDREMMTMMHDDDNDDGV